MTYGHQTPQQVVDAALKAVDKSSPTVISGAANTALAYFARFAPRQVMSPLAQWLTRAT